MTSTPTRGMARVLLAPALAGLALAALLLAWPAWQQRQAVQRGAALFAGQAPLPGMLAGHGAELPVLASRCSNCHALAAGPAGVRASGPATATANTALGGVLSAARLAQPQSRRGGPASTYDARRLCDLLRTGQDPAHVLVPATMPRYQADDRQCADLWAYLLAAG